MPSLNTMILDQSTINMLIAAVFSVIGWAIKTLHSSFKDLQIADKELITKVQSMEELLAGKYITKEEFHSIINAMFVKLDKIEAKKDESISMMNAMFSKMDAFYSQKQR